MMAPASQGAKPKIALMPADRPWAARVVIGPTVMRMNGTMMRMLSSGVLKLRNAAGMTRLRNRSRYPCSQTATMIGITELV